METTAHVQAGWIGEVDLASRPLGCTILVSSRDEGVRQTANSQIEAACTVRGSQIMTLYIPKGMGILPLKNWCSNIGPPRLHMCNCMCMYSKI